MFDRGQAFRGHPMCRLAYGVGIALLCLGQATAVSAAGNLAAGRVKAKACAVCHGIDGLGKRPDMPNLAGQNQLYMADQLRRYRSGRRAHPEMNVVSEGLSDQDIDDLARYYAAITITVELPK
jgi:cytochrome c553